MSWPKPNHEHTEYTGNDILRAVAQRQGCLPSPEREWILLVPFSFDFLCWVLAIQAAGHAPKVVTKRNLLRTIFSRKRHRFILPAKGFFLHSIFLNLLGHKTTRNRYSAQANTQPSIHPEPLLPALISHSSGSTGEAKTIQRSHSTLIQQHLALKTVFEPFPGQVDLPLFPNVLLHNLACGVATRVPDLPWHNWTAFDAGRLLATLKEGKVNTLTGNRFYFERLLAAFRVTNEPVMNIKAAGIGGSPIPDCLLSELQELFPGARLYVIYGSTEAEPIAVRLYTGKQKEQHGYGVGALHPGITLHLRDQEKITMEGKEVIHGEIGVSGLHVAGGSAVFYTGDYGFMLGDQLFLTGRKGNCQAFKGFFPYQVEHFLDAHIQDAEIAVKTGPTRLMVFYSSPNPQDGALLQALENLFGERPEVKITRLGSLPKDKRHHSKILYQHLHADGL